MVPLFERHPHFYVSVNIPPAILGSGQILPMMEALELTPYLHRIVCEVTERQALTHAGRSALEGARRSGMRSVAIDDFGRSWMFWRWCKAVWLYCGLTTGCDRFEPIRPRTIVIAGRWRHGSHARSFRLDCGATLYIVCCRLPVEKILGLVGWDDHSCGQSAARV